MAVALRFRLVGDRFPSRPRHLVGHRPGWHARCCLGQFATLLDCCGDGVVSELVAARSYGCAGSGCARAQWQIEVVQDTDALAYAHGFGLVYLQPTLLLGQLGRFYLRLADFLDEAGREPVRPLLVGQPLDDLTVVAMVNQTLLVPG
jgi:hypothetical protein